MSTALAAAYARSDQFRNLRFEPNMLLLALALTFAALVMGECDKPTFPDNTPGRY